MRLAIEEAHQAANENEVPIGCIIIRNNKIIGRGHNRTEALQDPTAHAEIIAITAAARALNNWRLIDTTVYVTIEPCLMCTGALILARTNRVVFGATDEKFGCLVSNNIMLNNRFNHHFEVTGGVLAQETAELLKQFFEIRRR